MDVVDALCDLKAPQILIKKAHHDPSMELKCMMPVCFCPDELGGRYYFVKTGNPKNNPWMISVDREIPFVFGGEYTLENSRPAHKFCNQSAGAKIGGHRGKGKPKGGRRMSQEDRVRIGRLGQLATPPEVLSQGGKTTCCLRWNVRRGKPCTCGRHTVGVEVL